jgi:putative ABC transport system permease protein
MLNDLRYGIRTLLKCPGFTAIAVLTLALGIGATTAFISVIDPVLLRPLSFKDSDRLVIVLESKALKGFDWLTVAPANFVDWRNQNRVFQEMTAARDWYPILTGAGRPEHLHGAFVTANFFSMLGVQASLGRTFLSTEDQLGQQQVVLLSHGFWQRRFGSDPAIVGQVLTLDDKHFMVIGVLPPSFQFASKSFELWAPLVLDPTQRDPQSHALMVFASLKPEVTLGAARTQMETIARRLEREYPKTNTGWGVMVRPIREFYVSVKNIRLSLLVLLSAVSLVLLIACANVANLLLVCATARRKEIAVRMALGASRIGLVRQLLIEGIPLSLLGGGAGCLLAWVCMDLLVQAIPYIPMFHAEAIGIDRQVLAYTVAVSLLASILFGLVPALQASKLQLNDSLKEGGRHPTDGAGRRRTVSLLVVSEVALAFMLLVGAGLLGKSFLRLQAVQPGFNPDNILTVDLELPESRYPDAEQQRGFFQKVLQSLRTVRAIESVRLVSQLPLTGFLTGAIALTIQGRPAPPPGKDASANDRVVEPDYFRTIAIPLLKGRSFTERDNERAPSVVLINETMARQFWPGEDPIGQRVKLGNPESDGPWYSIIGIVGDVKDGGLESDPRPQIYRTYLQYPVRGMTLLVRAASQSTGLTDVVSKVVWAVDKDQPIYKISTLQQLVGDSLKPKRFCMWLLQVVAAVALFLAALGIYGVISFAVRQRTHDIGVRVALGAQRRDVLKLVIFEGMRPALIGLVVGLAGAYGSTRVLTNLLYGISPTDPGTFATIAIVLTGVALLACYIPARQATKVDPMVALRYE